MDQGVLEDRGRSIALSGFKIEYTKEQIALKSKIADMYRKASIEMLRTDDIMALGQKGIVSAILGDLVTEGVIIKVNPSYYISVPAWDEAVAAARSFDGEFTLAEYRDKIGTSRKYAAELLPAMDRAGLTVFNGTTRKIIKK